MNAHHDPNYVFARDQLIAQAEQQADNSTKDPREWSRSFMQAMDELAEKAGLCIPFRKMARRKS